MSSVSLTSRLFPLSLFKLYCSCAVALFHLDVDFAKHVFGVLGEVAVLNPVIVLRCLGEDFLYALALVLTEVEYYHTLVVADDASGKVHIAVLARITR